MIINPSQSAIKVSASVTLGDFSVKRDGRVFVRFDVPTVCTLDAFEAVKLSGKVLVCVAQYADMMEEEHPPKLITTRFGAVVFGGMTIKKMGESVLVLETHEEALALTLEELRQLREKEMRLSLIYYATEQE